MKYKQQLEELEAYVKEWDEELEEAGEEEIIELTPEVIAAQEKEMQNTGKALCIGIAFFNIVFFMLNQGSTITKSASLPFLISPLVVKVVYMVYF